ncbi:MAG: right-handed parallel beta-helix repeat-containing protein, partial [Pseudomonadales bacterium]
AALSQREKPSITNVVHSGVGQYLKYGDTLQIGLEGEAGMMAAGVVEGIGIIDLEETAPGQYVGSISLGRDLDLDGVVVTGRLQNDYGQTASWISPYGLLIVDNTPPGQITDVIALSRDGGVQLRWQPPSDRDVAKFQIAIAESQTGPANATFESSDPTYMVAGLTNFEPIHVLVSARDLAGNVSSPTRIQAIPAPDERFGTATQLDAEIPAVITGTKRLTAAGNPYHLRTSSRIETGASLFIGPGVEISVSPRAKLSVLGELHTFGSATAPVVASDIDGQGFDEFLVLQSNAPVSLDGLIVSGAGIPLQITAGNPLIANCALNNSRFNAISISGAARPVIRNCTISGAMASGVIIQGQSQPTFEGNRFINNEPFHLQNGSNYQVNASGNTFEPPASSMTVLGDVLY